jgi:activator of 2-hydroxyglutaryl-CoA dehydratase
MFHLGLDFGSTLTKMAMTKPGALDYPAPQAIFQYKTHNDPSLFYKALEEFLKAENISLSDIDGITATGTHANVVRNNILNIPTRIVGEVESIEGSPGSYRSGPGAGGKYGNRNNLCTCQ